MLIHYFYNLAMLAQYPALKKYSFLVILVTYPLFLLFLPSTGLDFDFYEAAYITVFYDPGAPLWFRSASVLTAEPGWFAYTGLFSFLIEDFRWFLVANFVICLILFNLAFEKMGIDQNTRVLMIIAMVPIIMPTIMFWSVRSSISLALFFLGSAFLVRNNLLLSFIFLFLCVTIHSQYLPLSGLIFAVAAGSKIIPFINRVALVIGGIVILTLSTYYADIIAQYLTFLPTAQIISSKLHYLESAEAGMRYSSFLSIIVYPLFLWFYRNEERQKPYFYILVMFVFFSLAINLFFITTPHIAGRLARASDYFMFCYVLAFMVRKYPVAGFWGAFAVIAVMPFLFGTLYEFSPAV